LEKIKKASALSIAALVTGALGLSVIPIILGSIDLKRISKGLSGTDGKILDIIAIILGVLGIIALAIVLVALAIIKMTFYYDNMSSCAAFLL